jgi:hypothetical protein
LINTTRQIGGALGLAVMATVASGIAASHGLGDHPGEALASGYRAAFIIAGCGMIGGVLLATFLPKLKGPDEVVGIEPGGVDAEVERDQLADGLVAAES